MKLSFKPYRHLLLEAWQQTCKHPHLWLCGVFAGFASLGGFSHLPLLVPSSPQAVRTFIRSFLEPGQTFDAFAEVVRFFMRHTPQEIFWYIALLVLFCAMLLVTVSICQAGILAGLREADPQRPSDVLRLARPFFLRVIGVDLAYKAVLTLLLFIGSCPLLLLSTHQTPGRAWFAFLSLLLVIPAALLWQLLSTLTLVGVVRADRSIIHSTHDAWVIFRRHPLATVEFAVLVLLMTAGILLVSATVLILVLIPLRSFLLLLSSSLPPPLQSMDDLFILFVSIGFPTIVGGIMTVFSYAAWQRFYEHAAPLTVRFPIIAKLRRLF